MAGIVKPTNPKSAKIIRTSAPGEGNPSVRPADVKEFNLADLAQQGRDQLQRCQRQVAEMLEEAREQAEQIKASAHAAGYAEGQQAAKIEIEERVDRQAEWKAKAHVESLHAAVVNMKEQYDAWMQQYADALTSTAIAAADQLTRSQLTAPNHDAGADAPEHLLVRWSREALHSTRSASRLTLAVHPDTFAQLGNALRGLLSHADLPESSDLIADPTLALGDVVVRQAGGEIHAGLDAQLHRLQEELR